MWLGSCSPLEWSWTQESFAGDLESEIEASAIMFRGWVLGSYDITPNLLVDLGSVGQWSGLQHF